MVYPHKWSPISCKLSAKQESSPAKDRRSSTVPHNQPEPTLREGYVWVSFFNWLHVPSYRNSVLSPFNFRRLDAIHSPISSIQLSSLTLCLASDYCELDLSRPESCGLSAQDKLPQLLDRLAGVMSH